MTIEIRIGMQHLSLPEGVAEDLPQRVEVELSHLEWSRSSNNTYETIEEIDDFGTAKEFAEFFRREEKFLCVRHQSMWNTCFWAWGKTPYQALIGVDNPALCQGHFQGDYYMSYIYRNVLKCVCRTPVSTEFLRKKFPIEFDLDRTQKLRTNSREGKIILFSNQISNLIFQYSGNPDYPLGVLLWGQKFEPSCAQYIGGGKAISADAVVTWSLNDLSVEQILSATNPKALERVLRR